MSETAVERRLRDLYETHLVNVRGSAVLRTSQEHAQAIDAGREAIALLREHSAIATNAAWAAKRRALLARCEGE